MRGLIKRVALVAGAAVVLLGLAVGMADAVPGGTWGTAEQVPGTAALNAGEFAATYAVSCAPAGHCSAGGFYTDRSGHQQAFVVGQT